MIDTAGVPSSALMESAGRGVADAIVQWWSGLSASVAKPRVQVLCGPGNNGGDGYVVARHLESHGWFTGAKAVYPPTSEECKRFHGVAERLGLVREVQSPDVVVDAIFGIGQRAPLELPAFPLDGARLVALDVPTGIDADTGARVSAFPAPDFVVCIGRRKPCLYRLGIAFVVVNIGLDLVADSSPPEAWELLVPPSIPRPAYDDNKWSRGKLGIRAGSASFPGAAVLACMGALRAGAGLVTLFTPREVWPRLSGLPPEVMVAEPGGEFGCDALVMGPGLGPGCEAEVVRLWDGFPGPAVFDAEALRAVSTVSAFSRVVTPHAGEAAAMLGVPWRELEADRFAAARKLAHFGVAIYKGANPVVAGKLLTVVRGENPVLGTGGTGDCFAGVVGALLARAAGQGSGVSFDQIESIAVIATWAQQHAARGVPVGTLPSELAVHIGSVLGGG